MSETKEPQTAADPLYSAISEVLFPPTQATDQPDIILLICLYMCDPDPPVVQIHPLTGTTLKRQEHTKINGI